jgi:hypothetical protein
VPCLRGQHVLDGRGYVPAVQGRGRAVQGHVLVVQGQVHAVQGRVLAVQGHVRAVHAVQGHVRAVRRRQGAGRWGSRPLAYVLERGRERLAEVRRRWPAGGGMHRCHWSGGPVQRGGSRRMVATPD